MKHVTMTLIMRVALLATLLIPFLCFAETCAGAAPPVVGFVLQIQGKVSARSAQGKPRMLARYSPLYTEDVITLDQGARLEVQFNYGQHQVFTTSTPVGQRKIVPPQPPANDARTRLWRAISDAQRRSFSASSRNARTGVRAIPMNIPMLEARLPSGHSLSARPIFRWRSLAETPVDIEIRDDQGQSVWSQKGVKGDSLAYPPNAPSLQAGLTYRWEVSLPGTTALSEAAFTLPTATTAETLSAQLAATTSLDFPDDEARRLACAALLMEHNLFTDVIEELRPLSQEGTCPLIHAMLSNAWRVLHNERMALQELKAINTDSLPLLDQFTTM